MAVRTLTVALGERSYPIHIGPGLLRRLPEWLGERGIDVSRRLFVVTDEHVASLYLESLGSTLDAAGYQVSRAVVPAGEQAKSLTVYEQVVTQAIESGVDRKSVVLALGGGVVGDLAGFVAATYMRGIPFVQIPTTLLAHDSSVGGKVAINHPLGKNLVGAFHQPLMVVYDTDTLKTLPPREVAAGFAEVVKHALIADASFADWLEANAEGLNRLEGELVARAIHRGCAIKAEVVSQDETEQGIRALLNLGHTFGHAFEALGGYTRLNHGEAIAIGMVLAARLSELVGLAEAGIGERVRQLLAAFRLPVTWPRGLQPETVLDVMRRDKKAQGGKLTLILLRTVGTAEIVRDVDERIVLEAMKAAREAEI